MGRALAAAPPTHQVKKQTHQVLLQREQAVGVAEVVDVARLGNLHEVLAGAPCTGRRGRGTRGPRAGRRGPAKWRCWRGIQPRRGKHRAVWGCHPRLIGPLRTAPAGPCACLTLSVAGCAPGGDVALLHEVHHDVLHCRAEKRRRGGGTARWSGKDALRACIRWLYCVQSGALHYGIAARPNSPARGNVPANEWGCACLAAPGRWSASVNWPLRSARFSSVALLSSLGQQGSGTRESMGHQELPGRHVQRHDCAELGNVKAACSQLAPRRPLSSKQAAQLPGLPVVGAHVGLGPGAHLAHAHPEQLLAHLGRLAGAAAARQTRGKPPIGTQ